MPDPDLSHNAEGAVLITLPERLDTAAASDVLANLIGYKGHDICLDFKDVKMLGTLCLQVLLNTRHHWQADGNVVSLKNIMPEVAKALADFAATPKSLMTGDIT